MAHEYNSPRGFSGDTSRYDRPRRFESRYENRYENRDESESRNRDFSEESGDRDRIGRGRFGNRVQGGNQGWYGGQESQGPYKRREREQQYGSGQYRSNQSGANSEQHDSRFGGRSNFGSSKYGGSDYASNDYTRNESRYGSPYEELSSEQQFGNEESWGSMRDDYGSQGRGAEVTGEGWSRNRAAGEWYSGSSGSVGGLESGQRFGQQSGTQSFRGKGPKGYTRSDERLKEIVCEMLTDAPHIDAGEINVEVKNGEVTLTGTVDSRQCKYAAEDLIEQRAGVTEIHNQLKVRATGQSSSSKSDSSNATGENARQENAGQSGMSQSAAGQRGSSKSEGDYGSSNRTSGDNKSSDKSSDKSTKQ